MRDITNRTILILLLLLSGSQAFCQNVPLIIDGSSENYKITGYTWFYKDCSGNDAPTADIQSISSANFQPVNQKVIHSGPSPCIYWFRFDVRNISPVNEWFLDIDYPNLNKTDIYVQSDNGLTDKVIHSGSDLLLKEKLVDNATTYAKLNLNPNITYRIFIRVETSAYLLFPAQIRSFKSFLQKNNNKHIFIFSIFGILLVSVIINFVFFLMTRNHTYLLLTIIMALAVLLLFYQFGFAFACVPELSFFLSSRFRLLLPGLFLFFLILFSIRYFRIKKIKKAVYLVKFSLGLVVLYCAMTILPLIPVTFISRVIPYLSLFTVIALMAPPIAAVREKRKEILFFLLAALLALCSVLLWLLVLKQIIPYNIWTYHIVAITAAFLSILIDLYLLQKITEIRKDKEAAAYFQSMNRILSTENEERKKAEEALRKSEKNFRLLYELSPLPVIVIEYQTGIITMVNEKFCEWLEYKKAQLIGGKWGNFKFFPEKVEQVIIDGLTAGGEVHKLETHIQACCGEIFDCQIHTSLLNFRDTPCMVLVVNDISLLVKDQKLIKKLYGAIEKSPNMLIISNQKFEVEYANAAFTRINGYSPDEIIGKDCRELLDVTPQKSFYQDMVDTIQQGGIWERELACHRKNGEIYWTYTVISCLTDANGEIVNYFSIQTDVTEKRNRVEALRESEQKLRELNATKDRFFSIIGHDLLNPFNALLGFSDLLTEALQEDNKVDALRYASIMDQSTRRILELLQNLLLWTRAQSGLIKYQPMLFAVNEEMMNSLSVISHTALKKGIDIRLDIEENSKAVFDNNMIGTVIRNLVSNAVKFTATGGTITITCRTENGELICSVADTGVGMSADQLKDLFRIDRRPPARDTENQVGTGLGLIISKEFIHIHQGRIWAESTLGKGSILSFSIPDGLAPAPPI